jgi:hypothetical protein
MVSIWALSNRSHSVNGSQKFQPILGSRPKIDFNEKKITWGDSTHYNAGGPNAITMDNYGNCIDVHVGTNRLFYSIGKIDFDEKKITWGECTHYDSGGPNAIAMDNKGNCVDVHVGSGKLFCGVKNMSYFDPPFVTD